LESYINLYWYGSRWFDPALGRFIQPDPIIPDPNDSQSYDRYAYTLNNPVRYTDPSGYFTEDEIKEMLGFDKDDPWEEVLKLFQKGGKYEGRWGWLETLRKAEIGDQITIDWNEGISYNGEELPNTFTFDVDTNGNLILTGDGIYFDAELGGLLGENYTLSHYTDLSDLCSPGKCGYTTEFSTSAIHEPYLHTKVEWGNIVTDMPGAVHVIEMGGMTIVTGILTIADAGIIGMVCTSTGPGPCVATIVTLGPVVPAGVVSTIGLMKGTVGVFMELFTSTTP